MNNEKNRLIPDLRFPEFANAEEWSIKDFGELIKLLADFTANGSFASLKENITYFSTEEYAVLVRTTDLDKKIFIPARFTDKRGYDFLSKTSLFGNEIVMANVGSIGKVFRVPYFKKPMTLAPNTYVLKFNDFVDEDFIYQLMLRSVFEQKLLSMVGSSTLMAINKSNLRSIKVEIPTLVEQQKIASCLSSLDELITAQKEKLELLKNHKKGLMQNLFPQEGETVPKFRFPEFENNGDWEEKILNEVADYENGKAHEQGIVEEGKFIVVNSKFISTEGGKSKQTNLANCPAKQGDVLMVLSDLPNGKALGKCFYITTDDKYTVNQRICKITSFDCDSKLLFYIMNRNAYFLYFDDGVKQTNLKNEDVQTFPFLLPKNKIEQEKIASCLSSLDHLISSQTEKIEKLQLHKKGLMQGLFPKMID